MSAFFDPFRSLTNEPFGQQFGSASLAGGSTGIPGLLSLWNAKTPTLCPVGPQIQTSAAGPVPDADGNLQTFPVNHPGKGVMVHPAYSNLLQNSKLEGAVSGTPGTAPTNWIGNGVGSILMSGAAVTFTSSANNPYWTQVDIAVSANTTNRGSVIAVCDGVLPVNQIILFTFFPAGAAITFELDGVAALGTVVPAAGQHSISVILTVGATAGTFRYRIGAGCTSATTGTVTIYNPQFVASPCQMPYAASGAGATVSVSQTSGAADGIGLAIPIDARIAAALGVGGKFTVAARVEMGVSSAQVTAPANILSVNDVAAGLIFADAGGKLKCTDGTNTAEVTVTGGWARTDELLAVVQCDGATFRIGYAKNTFSAITWGTAVAVGADGDWDVVTHERFGLDSTIVFGAQQAQTWGRVASEVEVLKVAGYAA